MSFTLDITRQNFVAPTLAVDLTGDDMLVWLNWALIALYIFFCYSYLRSFFVNSWEKETKQIMADNDIGIFDDFQFNHLAVIIPLVHCIWVMPNDVFVLPTLAFFVFTIWSFYAYTQISDTAYHLDKKKYQWRYMNKTQQSVRQNTTYSDFDDDVDVGFRKGTSQFHDDSNVENPYEEVVEQAYAKAEEDPAEWIRMNNPAYRYSGRPPPKKNPLPSKQYEEKDPFDFSGSRWANSRFKDQKAMNRYKSTYIAALTGENPTEKANSQIKLIQYDQGKDSRIAAWSED